VTTIDRPAHSPGTADRVRLVVEDLDEPAIEDLRLRLGRYATQPGAVIEVDLSGACDRDDVSLFALLAATARDAQSHRSHIVVLHPPAHMVASLSAAGLQVRRHSPVDLTDATDAVDVVRIGSRQRRPSLPDR
jgi:hypothetical protein